MRISNARRRHEPHIIRVNAYMVGLWLAGLIVMLALHKKGQQPLGSFLASRPGSFLSVSIILALCLLGALGREYWRCRAEDTRVFQLAVAMNLFTTVCIVLMAEAMIRTMARPTPAGPMVLGTLLFPRDWEAVKKHYKEVVAGRDEDLTFVEHDDLLGWRVGENRHSEDGLYFSSAHGIRTARQGMALRQRPVQHRIGIVGDSYTFGEEVRFEETWGYYLEKEMGHDSQVLNFGVPGYGMGQAYLRFERDVRPWDPCLVIWGFISHDLVRTMAVYPFVNFPDWEIPFGKPRFVRNGNGLELHNVPPLDPEAIFDKDSIASLPAIDYEWGYRETEWEKNGYHWSHLARLFTSWFPRYPAPRKEISIEELYRINGRLVEAFRNLANRENRATVIVYFPTGYDFLMERGDHVSQETMGKRFLRENNIPHVDVTPCVRAVPQQDRFVASGYHYSARSNYAVAKCLSEAILAQGAAKGNNERACAGYHGDNTRMQRS